MFHRIAKQLNPDLFVAIAESKLFTPALVYQQINMPIVG